MTRSVNVTRGGVGDVARALWIVEGAKSGGEQIGIYAPRYASVIEAFGGVSVDTEGDGSLVVGTGTAAYHEELHGGVGSAPECWMRTVGWDYPLVRPKLSLPQASVEWAEKEAGGSVVIAPFAAFVPRNLPYSKWLRIANDLEGRGIPTLAVDPRGEAVDKFPHGRFGTDLLHLLAMLSVASVVVGNDSGVTNLAATIGVPTIAVSGPTDLARTNAHCLDALTVIQGKAVCAPCRFGSSFSSACDFGCEALSNVPWETVRDAVIERRGAVE